MKIKFIILSWTVQPMGWYDGSDIDGANSLEEAFDPEIELAHHFDTYPEAEKKLEEMPGGTYQIDKIFLKD